MELIQATRLTEKLDRGIYYSILILALASCLSEPLSRNAARLILTLGLFRVIAAPSVVQKLQLYKGFFLAMASLMLVLTISAVYGGRFYDTVTGSTFWYNYNMLLFFVVVGCIHTKQQVRNIFLTLGASLLVVDFYIYWQSWHGVTRPISFLKGTVMLTAMLYAILVPAFLVLTLKMKGNLRWVYGVFTLMGLVAAFLNGTRGLWLTLGIMVLVILLYYRVRLLNLCAIACIALVVLGGVVVLHPAWGTRIQSVGNIQERSQEERLLMWQSVVIMAREHPILGVGMGNYADAYQHQYISPFAKEPYVGHAHSNVFQFLGEDGIIGLISYCMTFGYFLYWFWRNRQNRFAMGAFMATVSFLLYSMTDYTFAAYTGMRIYWLFLGICVKGTELYSVES